MEYKDTPRPLPRNPITHLRHRREVFWQITFPFVVVTLILLVLAFLAAGLSPERASRWADISLIWLIIPALLFSLLTMVFLGAGVYLITQLMRVLPFYFYRGHNWFLLVNLRVGRIGDKLTEPFLRLSAWKAGANALMRQARRR